VSYRTRVGGVMLACLAAVAFAAGCGSKSSPSAAPTASPTDYFTCLRDNGVNIQGFDGGGNASARPRGSGRPSGFPTARPSGFPTARPTGSADGGPGRFPGGGGGFFGSTAPSGVAQDTWDKAQKACASLRPSGNPQGRNGGGGANAAYRNCLNDHGVAVSGPVDQLNQSDPKVKAALDACAVLRPTAMPTPSR